MALIGSAQSINVERINLLAILKANLEKHKAEFKEAKDGYQQAMLDELKRVTKKVQKGEVTQLYISLPAPSSYEKNYVEVIEMLEMSVDDLIKLDTQSFRSYVKDEWHWSEGFKSLSATYSAGRA